MQHVVEEIELTNGAKGLLIDVPDAKVISYNIMFRAGDYQCSNEKQQLAHFTEHFLVAGANEVQPSFKEFHLELTKNAAAYGGYTTPLYVNYHLDGADFEWRRILELMLSAISRPLFAKKEFASELQIVKEELNRKEPYGSILGCHLRKKTGFISHTREEALASLDNINVDDIRQFWNRTYFAGNMRFIIAGDLKAKKQEIITLLSEMRLPQNEKNKLLELPSENLQGLDEALSLNYAEASNLNFLFYAFAKEKLSAAERIDIRVLAGVLLGGLGSRIFGKASERGLLYGSGSFYYDATASSSYITLVNQVSKKNALELFDLLRQEFNNVLAGELTANEVANSKQASLGGHYLSIQTVADVVNVYIDDYIYQEQITNYTAIPDQIKAVTIESITQSVRKLFAEKQYALGLLGESINDLEPELHCRLMAIHG